MKQENDKFSGLREELKGLGFLVEEGTYEWKCEWNAYEYVTTHHQEEWNNLFSIYIMDVLEKQKWANHSNAEWG